MLILSELLDQIRNYKPDFDEALIKKSYFFAKESHGSQKRHSGDLYFSHPVAVAEILIQLKLDEESIAAAFLHDVVEDTEVSLEEIAENFGAEISKLVDGITKLGKIEGRSYNEKIAEDFRKLTLAMSQDIRVLLIKLADRLHNMRTISYVPSQEKRIKKAQESLDIYAPLAGRIGLHKIKDELQELSFEIVNPQARKQIVEKLNDLQEKNEKLIKQILQDLKRVFTQENFNCEIYGREKKPYSIWLKMRKQNIGFHNIYDIMAFRIVTENIAECYKALGVINSTYSMIPGSFKDYISTPKENGYQSLHLAIVGPFSKKIEIQIRDKNMHEIAEMGVAAHWHYKEKFSKDSKGKVSKISLQDQQNQWIKEIITLFENSENAGEVLKQNRLATPKGGVFCFTPNGDIFNLPFKATVIDFAYAIHSEIGNCCISAKVNGLIAPLRHKLENGDQVEIITDANSKPSPNWLQFAITSKARSAIRSFIRSARFNEYSNLGKAILNKFFAARNLQINDEILEKILPNFNKKSLANLYLSVAEGVILREDILKAAYPDFKIDSKKTAKTLPMPINNSLAIDGLIPGMAIHYASCCSPIFGDKIIGVINPGSGISIHNQDCNIAKNTVLTPQRILEVCWRDDDFSGQFYNTKIRAVFENKSGALANATNVIANNKINIASIKTINHSKDFFEVIIDVEVKNLEQLEELTSSLRISGNAIEIERVIA